MSEYVRPEVVQALVDAVIDPTPATLERMAAIDRVRPAERAAADSLTLSTLKATADHRDRTMEVWDVLLKRQWESPPSWGQLFDELTEADIERLRNLYDAMPDGARYEFEARYGRPEL